MVLWCKGGGKKYTKILPFHNFYAGKTGVSIEQMEKLKLLQQPQKIERERRVGEEGLAPVEMSGHWAKIGNSGCQECDLAIGKSPTRNPTTILRL